jgi:hypothetical protein
MSLTKTHNRMIEGSVINVADFGALPSASASTNVTSIQAAIDSISSGESATLVFPKGTYDINGTINTNNRTLVIDGGGAILNMSEDVNYMFTVSGTACEVKNLFFTKGSGVTGSVFYVTGIRHVFNNLQSGNALWTYFFHLVDLKESKFSNLNVYLDTAGLTGAIFRLDHCVNNTFSDSFIGYCEHGVFESATPNPTYGYNSEGWLMSNVIIVYPQKAMTLSQGTLFSVNNCLFDFCKTWGIFQSNGNNLKVMNTWIASDTTNGFIGIGTLAVVSGVSVIGNVFVRGAAAITGTSGVSLQGQNALVIGNAFQSGMNGGTVTSNNSQVIGNSVSSPGINIVANNTASTILGDLSVEDSLTVNGSKGIFPQGVSGTATTQAGGSTLPALAKGYVTVTFDDGAGLTNYKIPYYNA